MRKYILSTLLSLAAGLALGRVWPLSVRLPANLEVRVHPHLLGGFTVECDSCTAGEVRACLEGIQELPLVE